MADLLAVGAVWAQDVPHGPRQVQVGSILVSARPSRRALLPLGARDGVDPKLVAVIDRLGQALRVQMCQVARANGLASTQLQLLVPSVTKQWAGRASLRPVGIALGRSDCASTARA